MHIFIIYTYEVEANRFQQRRMNSITYKVLACGSNGSFQLGNSTDTDTETLVPSKFFISSSLSTTLFSKPVKISCGGNHTLILLECGEIYASGEIGRAFSAYSDDWSLENGTANLHHFVKMSHPQGLKWINISCGWDFYIAVDEANKIYMHSTSNDSQSKWNSTIARITEANLKDSIQVVKDAWSSVDHTIILLSNGDVIGWGNSKKGQLGSDLILAKRVETPTCIRSGVCGVAVGRGYTVLRSGDGKFEYLGVDKFGISESLSSADWQVADFKSMWSSVHIYGTDRRIHSFGNNSHGQLYPQDGTIDIKKFDIGSEHGLVLTENNEVFSWGWGEHGNCGKQRDSNGVVFNFLNPLTKEIEIPGEVVMIGCGCATSWVVIEES